MLPWYVLKVDISKTIIMLHYSIVYPIILMAKFQLPLKNKNLMLQKCIFIVYLFNMKCWLYLPNTLSKFKINTFVYQIKKNGQLAILLLAFIKLIYLASYKHHSYVYQLNKCKNFVRIKYAYYRGIIYVYGHIYVFFDSKQLLRVSCISNGVNLENFSSIIFKNASCDASCLSMYPVYVTQDSCVTLSGKHVCVCLLLTVYFIMCLTKI